METTLSMRWFLTSTTCLFIGEMLAANNAQRKRPVNLSGELAQTGISLKSVEKSDYEAYIKNYFDEYFVLLQASEDVPALMKIFYHGRYFSSFIDDYISVLKKMAKKETERWKRTTFLNGRGQLKAYCPECDTALSGDTASRQYAFPVIGGPSVGKTCFINMAIDQMMSDVAPARSWEMSFISDTEEKDHALAMKSLNQGVRLMKTELNSLTAYQLMLKLPNEKIGRRIYVYDISGEMFSSSSDVQNNLAYSYANGFIFIIDPLTLNQFAMDVEDKVDLNAYGASSKDFEDILNIMLINLEKMFGLKDKDTLKRNLAVVINKVDIPTLEEKIGEIAAQQYLAENAETCKSYMDARDAVCRNFLEEYGAGNFVRTAEAKFKTVRYFTCSALGHNHEGQPYEGKNVVDPVMWLLQQADSSIKAE